MKDPALSKTHRWSLPPEPCAVVGEQRGTITRLTGELVGSAVTLAAGPSLFGRSPDAQVRLEGDGVSRCHARVVRHDKAYVLEDLGSTNGTFVDGVRLGRPVVLTDGCRIQMGTCLMRFALQDLIEQEASRRMYEMSVRDGLTGLYNRRHFDERLASEYAYAVRHRAALSVIVIDVDHFKTINDTWGHPAGDAVLHALGAALRETVRTEDLIARFGGEEFAVLCRGIDVAGTRTLAERIRATIEALRVQTDNWTLRLTGSLGAAHSASGGSRAEQLVASADAALYQAKRNGRNRVVGPLAGGQYAIHGASGTEAAGPAIAAQPLAQVKAVTAEPTPRRKARSWDGNTRRTHE